MNKKIEKIISRMQYAGISKAGDTRIQLFLPHFIEILLPIVGRGRIITGKSKLTAITENELIGIAQKAYTSGMIK